MEGINFLVLANKLRFRGPAPLHHTLLSGREVTGVTVQTLHPKHFDEGVILAQTSPPGFEHQCSTVPELSKLTAKEGASMLIQCIKDGTFVQPLNHKGHLPNDVDRRGMRTAPKITPIDRLIIWDTWTAEEILRRHRVIGPLWNSLFIQDVSDATKPKMIRLIWSSGFTRSSEVLDVVDPGLGPGQPYIKDLGTTKQAVFIRTSDNECLKVDQIKIEGGREDDPVRSCRRARLFSGTPLEHSLDIGQTGTIHKLFMNPLV